MAYLLVGKRAKEIAAAAAKYNLEYLERDPSGITRRVLSLFVQSDGHVAENLLVGRMRGAEVYGFDFPYLTRPGDDPDVMPPGFPQIRYENGNQYGCVLVPLEADLPLVYLTKRGRRGLLGSIETPVKVENKAFTKTFQAWSEDPTFLHRILTPEVVDLLVSTKGRFTFELYHDALLCIDYSVLPDEFPPLMSLAVALAERLPEAIWEDYPPSDTAYELPEPVHEEPSGFGALTRQTPADDATADADAPQQTGSGTWF